MTDQQINELVARKLNGWGPEFIVSQCRDYCHDINAAWEIVESMRPHNAFTITQHLQPPYGYSVTVWAPMTEESGPTIRADTAPMAICLAFLKVL